MAKKMIKKEKQEKRVNEKSMILFLKKTDFLFI